MSRPPDAIEASYAACRRVARQARSSFYPCFLLLKGPRRRAMEAIYAFMRHTDDLGDCPNPSPQRRETLGHWRRAVTEALADDASEDTGHAGILPRSLDAGLALLPALADVRHRFRIPAEHFFAVIEGVEMDLEGRRYRTFDELTEYCDRVASAVGLVCIHVWGFRGEGALRPARRCGLAFQLTNILRDLKEDAARGRIYLPLEELDRCGYSPDDLARGVADERFDRLMTVQIDRARGLYREGAELFDWLDPPGRRIFGMMVATYYRLLEAIARQPRRVLGGRVRLSLLERLRIAARWTLLPARRAALP